jgi:hypothetical protein
VGYSCILFGDAVRKAGGQRYFSLERDPAFAAVIMSLVDLAGLSDTVKVIVGSSDESIARLTSSGNLKHIDLMFLDHYKPAYTTDLKLCEELGLITKGSVLAADNVIKPGNPPYLEYVRSSVEEKVAKTKEAGESHVEGIAETNVKMYEKRYGKANFSQSKGNPKLVYESNLVNSYEPTGVPVRCPLPTTAPRILTRDRTALRSPDALGRYFAMLCTIRVSTHAAAKRSQLISHLFHHPNSGRPPILFTIHNLLLHLLVQHHLLRIMRTSQVFPVGD